MEEELSPEEEAFTDFVASLPDEDADALLTELEECEQPVVRASDEAQAALEAAIAEGAAKRRELEAAQQEAKDAAAALARAQARAAEAEKRVHLMSEEERAAQQREGACRQEVQLRKAKATEVRHELMARLMESGAKKSAAPPPTSASPSPPTLDHLSIEEELLERLIERKPELAPLRGRPAAEVSKALAPHSEAMVDVLEQVTLRRRVAADWWPSDEQVRARPPSSPPARRPPPAVEGMCMCMPPGPYTPSVILTARCANR